jgi:hypothetical protein
MTCQPLKMPALFIGLTEVNLHPSYTTKQLQASGVKLVDAYYAARGSKGKTQKQYAESLKIYVPLVRCRSKLRGLYPNPYEEVDYRHVVVE